jgi:hypothetical protein
MRRAQPRRNPRPCPTADQAQGAAAPQQAVDDEAIERSLTPRAQRQTGALVRWSAMPINWLGSASCGNRP